MSTDLSAKTLFLTGGSRGIGRAIALRAARDGANVVVAAKTDQPHPKLPGTIHTVAEEIEAAGGQALAIKMDLRQEDQVAAAVQQAVSHFGGIDILVNNASAIQLSGVLETQVKRFDLMLDVNARGTFIASQACLPYLLKAENPHILTLSPPLSLDAKWFRRHAPYTLSKYAMSLCVMGLAAEFGDRGVACNALWPRTVIRTAALAMLGGRVPEEQCRRPTVVADAAHVILTRSSHEGGGNFFIDEEVLRETGITDFSGYAVDPGSPLFLDLFVDEAPA